MKRVVLVMVVVLLAAGFVNAANVPLDGLTGLWRFQNSANKMAATIGTDLVNSDPANDAWLTGPNTRIGTDISPDLYSDGGIVQDQSNQYMTCYHGISANGGGSYVNEYTIAVDIYTGGGWHSLYQTAWDGRANDGDLWIDATTPAAAKIGAAQLDGGGYSVNTFNADAWHRIVWSVDNGNFFKVYVDGTPYLSAPGQTIDGTYSLELDRFHFSADNSWEDGWDLYGTAAVWGRALNESEVARMGGWIGGAAEPTPLTIGVPEPSAFILLAIGAVALVGIRLRKRS